MKCQRMPRVFALLAALLVFVSPPIAAQSGNELFQQALTKQRAEGKLDEAIALYLRIVREHASDHQLAAKALVQLGRAYERMGTSEARKAYERVVREYADQKDAASEARDRIAALQSAESRVLAQSGFAGPTTRMVLRSDAISGASITPDGRSLLLVDSTGNLTTRDLRTGEITRITHDESDWDEFADYAAASPDGRTFAYAWWNGPKVIWELRVADRRGGAPRVLISDSTIGFARPFGLTPDSRFVVAVVSPDGRSSELSLVSVATGARQVLATIKGQDPNNVALSPDGKYLLYDTVGDTIMKTRDIRILTLATRADTVLMQHPADDFGAMWGPSGAGVFFVSTRNGGNSGWYVRIRDGRAIGDPTMVRPDLGRGSRLGLTPDGALYYTPVNSARTDVYVAEIDPVSGAVVKPPEMVVSKTTGSNLAPSWSRDGKLIVYVAGAGRSIRLRALETGAETEFQAGATRVELTPDNQSIIAANLDRTRGQVGLYKIDVKSGNVQTIVERPSGMSAVNSAVPSADGRAVYYLLRQGGTARIMRRDLDTGAESTLYPTDDRKFLALYMALSRDGRWLAVTEGDRVAGRPGGRIRLIPVDGGADSGRVLGRLEPGPSTLSWAPDGRSIVAMVTHNGTAEFWSVPTDRSTPRKLATRLPRNVVRAQVNPDGRHLVLRIDDRTSELWVAEHFLPAASPPGKN